MARLLRRCGMVILALLALTACGSTPTAGGSSPSPTPPSTPSSVPTIGTPTPSAPATSSGTATCQVSQLSLSAGQPNAGAGQVQEILIFTNRSQAACSLSGYPGMRRLGAGGQQVATKVVRTPRAEATVTLAPGGTASFIADWHDQTGYTTPCATSQQLEVTPPNTTSQLTIPLTVQACPDGTINVTPVVPGASGGQ